MLREILLCLFVCVFVNSKDEICSKNGAVGVCVNLGKCKSAVEEIKQRKNPQICSFDGVEPVVCCIENGTTLYSAATTSIRPSTTTPEYIPPVHDYETVCSECECEPIEATLTLKKSGQKAQDMCIEYQEKYVYPCGQSILLTGSAKTRVNNCHSLEELLIIRGSNAEPHEYPYMVMIGYGGLEDLQFLCSGTLISDRFILTAATCSSTREIGPITHVLIGAYKLSDAADRSKIYEVKRVIRHPEYKTPSKYNDIALIETEKTIKLDGNTVPACLPVGDVQEERVIGLGWGIYHSPPEELLQRANLQKFSTAECSQKFGPVRNMKHGFDEQTQTCYRAKHAYDDTCAVDTGSPIEVKHKKIHCMSIVVGLASFGTCTLEGEPRVFTRVTSYVPWIESVVWPK